jgi:hypothetical protein
MDKNEAWRVWSQRIPADTTLEQAFKAGFVAGQESPPADEEPRLRGKSLAFTALDDFVDNWD